MQELTSKSFRNDINGLRAWAVMAVVFYHFGVVGFQGGFVGVDVFFVISGFLMTGLVVNGLDNKGRKHFSLIEFYLARARRIVPALVVLCFALIVIGWFFIPVSDYRQLGQHAATAVTFVSNFKFRSEGGYFDLDSHEKWLLHTWSLSVEWQFYLILPIAMMMLWRFTPSRRAITYGLLVCFVASLAYSVVLTPRDPSAAFYLLPTRAWEMLAGGLVFMLAGCWVPSTAQRRWVELVGMFLVLGAMVLMDPKAAWPGWLALVPVVGAVLILLAGRTNSIWTGVRVAQWLGSASYSIYLWHWPVIVALVNLEVQKNPWAISVGLLTTLLLGYASYAWIEQPFRRRVGALGWRASVVTMSTVAGVVALLGVFIHLKNGVSGRFDPRIDAIFAEQLNKNPRVNECHVQPPTKVPECTYGGPALGVIVLGDSHAGTIVRAVEKSMGQPEKHVLDWTYAGCPTLVGVHVKMPTYGDSCGQFIKTILAKQETMEKVPLIILNRTSAPIKGPNELGMDSRYNKTSIYFDTQYDEPTPEFVAQWRRSFIDTACQLAKVRPVYMVRPIPELRRSVPVTMGRAAMQGRHERVSISLEEYHQRHDLAWEAQDAARAKCGVRILDPLPYFCSDGRCWGDKDGLPLYYDDDHLSERGAALLIPMFQSVFKNAN